MLVSESIIFLLVGVQFNWAVAWGHSALSNNCYLSVKLLFVCTAELTASGGHSP